MSIVEPVLPDLDGACISRIVPALLDGSVDPLLPEPVAGADAVVLLVLDGLGWEQLRAREDVAPTLAAMAGRAITSVAPTTTVAALTSITCGVAPGEHGVVGYRVRVGDTEVLNVLRWAVDGVDVRDRVPPEVFQPHRPFGGRHVPVLTRGEFAGTGFTTAHLRGTRLVGWRVPSTMVVDAGDLVAAGEPFVYAYYDGVDRVAHEHGLGSAHYDAELRAADRLVADLLDVLPPSAALVVTADHGQVDVGDRVVPIDAELMDAACLLSGEGRFRWLHLHDPAEADDVAAAARARYGDVAWVVTRDEAVGAGWFGGPPAPEVACRLGDVALAPFEPIALVDPADTGPLRLVSRHGSLTAAEVLVPLVAARGRRRH